MYVIVVGILKIPIILAETGIVLNAKLFPKSAGSKTSKVISLISDTFMLFSQFLIRSIQLPIRIKKQCTPFCIRPLLKHLQNLPRTKNILVLRLALHRCCIPRDKTSCTTHIFTALSLAVGYLPSENGLSHRENM